MMQVLTGSPLVVSDSRNGSRNRPNLERTLKGEGKGDPKSKKSGHDIILSISKQDQSNLFSNREARKSVDVMQQI